jgi:hypothetical protein
MLVLNKKLKKGWRIHFMKKFSIIVFSMMLALAFISCSTAQKDDAAKADKKVETKADPKADCKAACAKTADDCVAKAGKVKSKLTKCDTAKTKCIADCDKPAKK